MTLPMWFRPIFVSRTRVQNHVIMKKLYVSWLKLEVHCAFCNCLSEQRDCFFLRVCERGHSGQALRLQNIRAQTSRAEIALVKRESRLRVPRLFTRRNFTATGVEEVLTKDLH